MTQTLKGGRAEDALRQCLHDLGPTVAAVKQVLGQHGPVRCDAAANLQAYLGSAGWSGVALEPLGDTGWLYVAATTPAGERARVGLPEAVLSYVNAMEGFPDAEDLEHRPETP
jgi:hypothetical protein